MAIPDFQTLMLPLLRLVVDGRPRRHGEIADALGLQFELTAEDRAALLPSGTQRCFDNRLRWAAMYLRKACLLESPARGVLVLTERGRKLLATNPPKVDMKVLEEYPEWREFRHRSAPDAPGVVAATARPNDVAHAQTPEEQIERASATLHDDLAGEIVTTLREGSPAFFEKVVIDVLVAMGYGGGLANAGQVLGRSGDGGIDGVIKQDKLGLESIHVQAKRWDGSVGRPVVQSFAGSLDGVRSRRGVMITTSTFTADARRFVAEIEKKIVLIDGAELARLMIEYGVGVETRQTYVIRKLDADYFAEE